MYKSNIIGNMQMQIFIFKGNLGLHPQLQHKQRMQDTTHKSDQFVLVVINWSIHICIN